WVQAIVTITKARPEGPQNWFTGVVHRVFAMEGVDATWAVFLIPAGVLMVWALLDWWLIKDTPEGADFPHLDPHDASSGKMDAQFTAKDLLRMVFASPLMMMFAVVELTSGVLRNG